MKLETEEDKLGRDKIDDDDDDEVNPIIIYP